MKTCIVTIVIGAAVLVIGCSKGEQESQGPASPAVAVHQATPPEASGQTKEDAIKAPVSSTVEKAKEEAPVPSNASLPTTKAQTANDYAGIPVPEKGRLSLVGTRTVTPIGDNDVPYTIIYIADPDVVEKNLLLAVKQVINVSRSIQDISSFSTGQQSGTRTVTSFIPFTPEKQGKKSFAIPAARTTPFTIEGTTRILADNSLCSSVEVFVVSSTDDKTSMSNTVSPTIEGAEGKSNNAVSNDPEPRKPPKPRPNIPIVKELTHFNFTGRDVPAAHFWQGHKFVFSFANDQSPNSGNQIRIWDVASGKQVGELAGHGLGVRGFLVLPSGNQALSRDNLRELYLWDLEERKSTSVGKASWARIAAGGERVLMGGYVGEPIIVWNVGLKKEERKLSTPQSNYFAILPDGRTALVAEDNSVSVWDIDRDRELRKYSQHRKNVNVVNCSLDGRRALSCDLGFPGIIHLWDIASGKAIRQLEGHEDSVWVAIFSPDGRRVLSCSGGRFGSVIPDKGSERAIRLWDAESGKEICWLEGHADRVHHLAFSADGRHAVSSAEDKTIRVWKLPE